MTWTQLERNVWRAGDYQITRLTDNCFMLHWKGHFLSDCGSLDEAKEFAEQAELTKYY